MNTMSTGLALLMLTPGLAGAVELDRSGQSLDPLFEEGNFFELSFASVKPHVDGTDVATFGGSGTGDVIDDFNLVSGGLKYQVTDRLSFAIIADEPYGSEVNYPEPGSDGGSVALGGTRAFVDSGAITTVARYALNDNFSVHGGLRSQRIAAEVTLSGLAYGPLDGYDASLDDDWAFGYVLGASYERKDIALRVAVTYSSEIDHEMSTTETLNGVPVNAINPAFAAKSTTDVTSPASINLDFQTGIAPETLLFGKIRYAWFEDTIVAPAFFVSTGNASLTDLRDNIEYSIGIGRRFTDTLSGSLSVGYEPADNSDLVSPLFPRNGLYSASLGVAYAVTDAVTLSTGVSYIWLGDAKPETADVARADFTDNDAVAIGMKLGYHF